MPVVKNGGLPIGIGIPMIMGANIGTGITSTIVSLGHVAQKREFQRAFSAAAIPGVFNTICVLMFLPLEIAFHFLERLSEQGVHLFAGALMVLLGVGLIMLSMTFMGKIMTP